MKKIDLLQAFTTLYFFAGLILGACLVLSRYGLFLWIITFICLFIWCKLIINSDYVDNYRYIEINGKKYMISLYEGRTYVHSFTIKQVKELGFMGKYVDVIDYKELFIIDINIYNAKWSKEQVREKVDTAYESYANRQAREKEISEGNIF